MTQRKMDRCGEAHRRRESFIAAGWGSLEDWALSVAPASPGAAVLDLGCGAGRLTIPCARAAGPTGSVLGVDISPDSIAQLQTRARREGLSNVTTHVGNLDDFLTTAGEPAENCACNELHALPSNQFDLIVSSYAIHYASDMIELLRSLAGRLRDGGRVFVCGPGEGTNREMDELVHRAFPETEQPPPAADFLSLEQMATVSVAYRKVDTHRLNDAVRFDKPDDLLTWWRNHDMHAPAADGAVEQAVREHFSNHGEFTLTKNVLGVLFHL